MKYELERYQAVYDEGINYHKENKHTQQKDGFERLFELIFLAAMQLKQYETAYLYYQERKNALPIVKRYLAELNLIEFKRQTHQPYITEIEALLKDVIPEDVRLVLLKDLMHIYLAGHEENKVLPVIDAMKKIDPMHSYVPDYLKTLIILKNYDEAKKVAQSYKGHPKYDMDAFLALLKVYLHEKDYHKATILDADYHAKLDDMEVSYLKEVYTLLMELYTILNNRLSYDVYAKKLKALTKDEKKVKEKTDEVIKDKPVSASSQFKPQAKKSKDNYQQMNVLIDLLTFAHQISETKNLRDFLRNFFMKADEFVGVKDYLVFSSKDEMLYHYKKERLYDKALVSSSYKDTVIGEVLKDGEERFGKPSSLTYSKNILTQKDFEDSVLYIYAYSLFDLGAFVVYLDKDVIDPALYFDLFKGISAIIYAVLTDDEKRIKLRLQNDFLNKIIASDLMPLRVMSEHQSSFNVASQRLLNADSHMPYEAFLRNLGIHEVKNYEVTFRRLIAKGGLSDAITYLYNGKQIREKMVSILDADEVKIVSVFEDLSGYYEEKSKLVMEATVDFETSLQNLNALNQRLPELIKDKGSFMLITFNESILPIYGYDDTLRFFKEFGQLTKKFFEAGEVYRFSMYQLFVYIPMNDIRSVTKTVKDYIKYLDTYVSQVISYEKFNPKLSIIRYPVVTEEKIPAKLFRYLELSLDYLKRQNSGESYVFFEHKIYEDEVFEQQVINYLNQAMDQNQLSLAFNQIIDIKRNIVWQYESDLMLDHLHIDSKYLLSIAKKRNRLFDLEKYHIEMVCQFLSILEKETEKLVKITIPVSKETFLDINFNPFVFGLFQKYQIPFEFIRFKVKGEGIKTSQYLTQIDELAKSGVGLDTTSVEIALSYPFNAVHIDDKQADQKWSDYISLLKSMLESHQMALVIRNVKTKDKKEVLEKLGIKYVEGTLYKRITADALLVKIAGSGHAAD